MNEEAIGRAGFLKRLFRSAATTAYELSSGLADETLKPLRRAEESVRGSLAVPLIPVCEYGTTPTPKLLIAHKPPLYLVGDIEGDLRALSATCPNDSFLLTYLPQDGVLYCAACGARHVIEHAIEL